METVPKTETSPFSAAATLPLPLLKQPVVLQGSIHKTPIQKPLSATDAKINWLVIIREILVGAALLAAVTFIVLAVVLNPLWALAIIPPVALGILASHMNVQEIKETPAIRPQPSIRLRNPGDIGFKNMGANCWAIAAFAFLCKVNCYREALTIQQEIFPCLYQNLIRFQNATESLNKKVAQEIREWLAKETSQFKEISSSPYQQNDPMILIEHFVQKAGLNHKIQMRSYNPSDSGHYHFPESGNQPLPYIDLTLDEKTADQKFGSLIENFFTTVTDIGVVKKVNFEETPRDLLVQVKRGYLGIRGPEKITANIHGIDRFNLREEFCTSQLEFARLQDLRFSKEGRFATYECDAFIKHLGSTPNSGHYVLYFKENGKWHHLSDSVARLPSEQEVTNAMQAADIFHFNLIGGNMPLQAL